MIEWYFNTTVDEAIKIFIGALSSCVVGVPVRYCARFINLSLTFSFQCILIDSRGGSSDHLQTHEPVYLWKSRKASSIAKSIGMIAYFLSYQNCYQFSQRLTYKQNEFLNTHRFSKISRRVNGISKLLKTFLWRGGGERRGRRDMSLNPLSTRAFDAKLASQTH